MTRLGLYNNVIELFKRDDKDSELYTAYNETIKEIAARLDGQGIQGIQYQSWVPMVVGQEDYPFPDDLLHIIHPVRFLEGGATNDDGYSLTKRSKEEYDILEPNPNRTSPDTGKPTSYTVFSNSILTHPISDSATYLLEINWCKMPTSQDEDADVHPLGAHWDEVLKWGTLWRLYIGLGMDSEAMKWMTLYNDEDMGVPAKMEIDKAREETITRTDSNNL